MDTFYVQGVKFIRQHSQQSERWEVFISFDDERSGACGYIGSCDYVENTFDIAKNWLNEVK